LIVQRQTTKNIAEALSRLDIKLPAGVKAVGYESVNTVKNTGNAPWSKATGLLSMWILGMYNASPAATVVIPSGWSFRPGPTSKTSRQVSSPRSRS
jgi:hypothetical protein